MAHTQEQVRAAIDAYEAGADLPGRLIRGLTKSDLTAYPVPGTWSIQEIILHLMDSDLIASGRMKRTASEPHALIMNYDESAFARTLGYQRLDAELACELFRLNRRMTAAMLRQLPLEAFERQSVHSQRGLRSLYEYVTLYAQHLEHHAGFARNKRALLGKPLPA